MTVVRLDLAYDGTDFRGFARQPGQRTVEGEIRDALEGMYEGRISVGGRTDAGVHARGQVISFHSDLDPVLLERAVNTRLGPEVLACAARRASAHFDARTSATGREYRYDIAVGKSVDPLAARFVWHRSVPDCSLVNMRRAAIALVGHRDFASFGTPPVKGGDTFRRVERVSVSRAQGRIRITVRGNAFLRQMVRSLVGTLLDVGAGRTDPGDIADILAARSRNAAGRVAPARGLTLVRVTYGRAGACGAAGVGSEHA